MVHFEKFFGMF